MADHEASCVRSRLGDRPVTLVRRNALEELADTGWLRGADAVLIGGSGAFSVHHPASQPWVDPLHRVVEELLTQAIPTFGICFGHQLLGRHLGSTVVTDKGRAERGTVAYQRTAAGAADPIFGRLNDTFHAHTGHTDLVTSVPEGVALMASTEVVQTQAFAVQGAPCWTAQFHPDLSAAEARDRFRAYADAMRAEGHAPPDLDVDSLYAEEGDVAGRLLGDFLDHVA
jgi:GMP synthase (glutamine-hydrolysing)